YGTISSLSNVKEEYTNALEIVAGAKLNAIVVKDDKTAVECIKELKKNRIGHALFLPLNKILKRNIPNLKDLKNKKGVIGSALELVNYDKQYENAFSNVFGGTLIVNNIDTARKVGVGRARMVTLEGDLFETTGLISGGYRKKTFGKFLEKDLNENIKQLSNEIKSVGEGLFNLEKQKDTNEDKIAQLRERKSILQGELLKFETSSGIKNINELKQNKDKIENEINQVDTNLQNSDDQIKNINSKIQDLR
ncbi:unnamed protein product, partial [marine sediment metagenome]